MPENIIQSLSATELRAILLHENAHRRRLDPLRSVVQQCALTVFFFYPLLWMLLHRLNSSCEIACDEAAIDAGVEAPAYARALARTLSLGLEPSVSPAALNQGRSSLIRQRLDRLDQPWRYVAMTKHRIALALAIVFVAVVSLVPVPPLADVNRQTPPPPTPAEAENEDLVNPPVLVPETMVRPEYPEACRKKGIQGDVLLDVTVLDDGTVGEVTVKEGVKACPVLDKNAEAAIRQWKFKPATRNGEPLKMTIAVPFSFKLNDKEALLDVDTMPEMINESIINPVYPEDARKAGISGKVTLEVQVLKDGSVSDIEIVETIADYPSLGRSAVDAVSQWRFKPATKDEKPVDAFVKIPVMFRLDPK